MLNYDSYPSEVQNLNGEVENDGIRFGHVHIRILTGMQSCTHTRHIVN